MTVADLVQSNAAQVRALARQHRAANPRVFGSVLHGTNDDASDIDILVDPLPGTTLFDLGGLQVALSDLLGRRVDLLTPKDISVRFRDQVVSEARPI